MVVFLKGVFGGAVIFFNQFLLNGIRFPHKNAILFKQFRRRFNGTGDSLFEDLFSKICWDWGFF